MPTRISTRIIKMGRHRNVLTSSVRHGLGRPMGNGLGHQWVWADQWVWAGQGVNGLGNGSGLGWNFKETNGLWTGLGLNFEIV